MKQKLEEMVSENCYNEIISNIKKAIGNDYVYKLIGPTIISAIENGSGKEREEILLDWLQCESCRICTECGGIMEVGYYLAGDYACSDECRNENYKRTAGCKTDEEAERAYLLDCHYLDEEDVEGMTNEEIIEQYRDDDISDEVYYTEWY